MDKNKLTDISCIILPEETLKDFILPENIPVQLSNNDKGNKKTVDRRYIYHMFPYLPRKDDYEGLKIDFESATYISTKDVAYQITKIILFHLDKLSIEPANAVIVDATAGVGGNTLSFSTSFREVIAIELDHLRYEYLRNNIEVYRIRNIQTIQGDCLEYISKINSHVVFFDPPWGGKGYKLKDTIDLFLSDTSMSDIMEQLLTEKDSSPELIVIKVPKNFNLEGFYFKLKSKHMFLYNLNKMDIIVIENEKKLHPNTISIVQAYANEAYPDTIK